MSTPTYACLVEVVQEETVSFETRYYFSGSSLDMSYERQWRKVTTTTTRVQGSKADVEAYCEAHVPTTYSPTGSSRKVYTIRKINGPYWEGDITEETATAWTPFATSSNNS